MHLKGFIIGCVLLSLSGCASFIAHEITRAQGSPFNSEDTDVVKRQVCDTKQYCITTLNLPDNYNKYKRVSLEMNLQIERKRKIWRFVNDTEKGTRATPLTNELIVIFPGYHQPAEIFYVHQQWLKNITGAEVIVVPSPESSESFQFGLDFTAPLLAEIQRLQPKAVHLVGFSMGALAAQAVAQHTDNARLYLFAPMTDFAYSTKALYNMSYKDKFYTAFISPETLDNAIQIVYDKSGVSLTDTDLLNHLNQNTSPTFVYASNTDKITNPKAFNAVQNRHINVTLFDDLIHLEMVAFFSLDILSTFVSDLLGRQVANNEIATLGILCDYKDSDCLSQIPED
ncbi:alpha/beta fold hydrolase [Alteromonas gilva]|uniref:AB hydrolase-1 domain-containing protein n=1 Tax=Alteromonas gilva TaxID=2987522 RepID=A0ABT5L181_9ALTE|nr:alpha/beta fold hydrolase [Alteromonas gilva]MDC8830787.1 hypothetical protein [Alteromonas gilva]